jgi:hypothetical protein
MGGAGHGRTVGNWEGLPRPETRQREILAAMGVSLPAM